MEIIALAVITILFLAALDLHWFVALLSELSVLRLDNWSVLTSGSLYVLSYPTACLLLNMSAYGPHTGNLSNAVLIACPSPSYIAIVSDGDYYVSCNATEVYKGWGLVDRYYGYVYVYSGVRALSCIDVSVSSLQNYLQGYESGHITAMYRGAYGKIIIDGWTSGLRG